MAERQRRKTIKVPLLVLLLYMLIGGVFLATSTGSFVVNFKELGFSIVSSVQRGVNSVYTGIKTIMSFLLKSWKTTNTYSAIMLRYVRKMNG